MEGQKDRGLEAASGLDGRVEPLRSRLEPVAFRGASWTVAFFFFAGVVAPVFLCLGRCLVDFDSFSLSVTFVKILLRSFLFASSEAAVSAVFSCLVGILLGNLLALSRSRWGNSFLFISRSLGLFLYSLPTLSLALFVLELGHGHAWLPTQGYGAIVWAHFLMNVLYVAAASALHIRAWLAKEGLALYESSATLGARNFTLYKNVFGALWKNEWKQFFSLIFMWSFMAFSTVLILGGGPEYSTPEVLLFYSLKNNFEGTRILFLMLFQLACSFILTKWTLKNSSLPIAQSSTAPLKVSRITSSSKVELFAGLVFCLCAWPFVYGFRFFIEGGQDLLRGHVDNEMLQALAFSLALLVLVLLIVAFFLFLLLGSQSSTRKKLSHFLGLSSSFLMAAWLMLRWDLWISESVVLQLIFSAVAIVLLYLPLMAFWIEGRLQSLPWRDLEAAALMGCSKGELLKEVLWPHVREVALRILFLVGLSALGEIAIVSVLLSKVEVMASLSQKLAVRYDFSGSSKILFVMSLLTILGLVFERKILWQKSSS